MKLRTDIVVNAALRKANNLAIPAFILKKGDPNAGAIFLEIEIDKNFVHLLHRRFDFDENEIWEYLNKGDPQPANVIEKQIQREVCRDPDCWIVSVQDRQARNIFNITSI